MTFFFFAPSSAGHELQALPRPSLLLGPELSTPLCQLSRRNTAVELKVEVVQPAVRAWWRVPLLLLLVKKTPRLLLNEQLLLL
jgi:hypothetical protein